jgi:Mg-chelatase subunit ChlD
MTFENPWWLLALIPVLAIALLVARKGGRTVPRAQHRWAVIARTVALVLLVLAAAAPILSRAVEDRHVLFLVDRSASISSEARTLQEQYMAAALDKGRPADRSAIAVFGSELRLDSAFTPGREFAPIRTEVDGSASDLAAALLGAAALMPSEGSRRIIVLTDLVATGADPREVVTQLDEAGIAVDVVSLDPGRAADALVESVRLPSAVRQGENVTATVVIRSNVAGTARLVVTAGTDRQEIDVELEVGRNEVEVEVPAGESGFLRVDARLTAPFDQRPENDQAEGITRVLGPAKVAIVEGAEGEADEVARALEAGGINSEIVGAIPGPEQLLTYDAVVLVNVDRPSDEAAAALASFVEDLGRGLVVIGGDRSFGLGDYHLTPLESVLPVSSNPDDLVRRQPVAEVLVIDSSGSMAACHCNGGTSSEGGIVKTDIAKAGAELAIEALSDTDRVGVLAFTSSSRWVLPLAQRPGANEVRDALGTITPNGDTEISRALEVALESLEGVPESLRHIVLFTDGWDPSDANLLPIARKIADAGVTLSVLGTGEGPGTALQRMAELGGGRYYPGDDLESIPDIFVEETLTVARNLAEEGTFFPTLAAPSQVTAGLTSSPALLGYVLTKAKGTASVGLEIGPGDPLFASWQRGLGRASVWTSDATARWSSLWVDWDGFVDFWGRVVRDVLPAGRDNPPEVVVESGRIRVSYHPDGAGIDDTATARIRLPDGEVVLVPMSRLGSDTFVADAPSAGPGAYWVSVVLDGQSGTRQGSSSGAVSSYQDEFAFREPDPTLAAALTEPTGGRIDPAADSVFDPAPVRGSADVGIWPWLVGLALALFLADVALRRLVFTAGDSAAWKSGFTPARARGRKEVEVRKQEADASGQPPPALSESETLQRLMRRKRS